VARPPVFDPRMRERKPALGVPEAGPMGIMQHF